MSRREFLASSLERSQLGSLLSKTVGNWAGLVVFNYHRVGDESQTLLDRGVFSARSDEFDHQVRFLKKNFDVISVSDLEQIVGKPGRYVMITFDDGYIDNYELAYPILKSHQVQATFFLTTGYLDHSLLAWWDEIAWMVRTSKLNRLHPSEHISDYSIETFEEQQNTISQLLKLYKSTPISQTETLLDEISRISETGRAPTQLTDNLWMNWDMVKEMYQSGMEFGGHTVTHPVLAQTTIEQQRKEIFESKARIEVMLGQEIHAFSYPVGQQDSFSPLTQDLLKEAGYQWAFSFFGGYLSLQNVDPFNIPRIAVAPNISRELFQSTARLPWLFA